MRAAAQAAPVLRPSKGGFGEAVVAFFRDNADAISGFLRAVCPILNLLDRVVIVTRNDDVREVLLNNRDFHVEQSERLSVVMDGVPFMLGLDNPDVFARNAAPLLAARKAEDIGELAQKCRERAAALIADANGRLEVVDFIRQVALEVFGEYVGVQPAGRDLLVMATRVYEFQVAPINDPALTVEADAQAQALRGLIDQVVATRKADGRPPRDDVLGRLILYQAQNKDALSDAEIRANLVGLIVGALPQLPIAAPEALNQLLSRRRELDAATASARVKDDETVGRYLFEALRFDPMAPFLLRRCVRMSEIASGTRRHATIKPGAVVAAVLLSAMKDPRRVADPQTFDPRRGWATYMHFGHGLHTCFAEQINRAVIPAMLQPLLACDGLARERGRRGRLVKRGFFADQLWVTYTPPAPRLPHS